MISYLFIALLNAVTSFVLFRGLYLRSKTRWPRAALAVVAFPLATPAVLFASNYLLHTPDGVWFVNFHSLPGIEASSGLVGALLGVVFAFVRMRPRLPSTMILLPLSAMAAILLILPFAKQLFFRLDYSTLENRWQNGTCLQTSLSTCVPASCATVIRTLGGTVTERDLAKSAGTSTRGTEIWYMKRALHKYGYEVDVRKAKLLKDMPVPSVIGVGIGRAGHVVVLMSKNVAGPEIADPLGIRRHYTWEAVGGRYHPNGSYFVIRHSK